jgi:hypothetical protein
VCVNVWDLLHPTEMGFFLSPSLPLSSLPRTPAGVSVDLTPVGLAAEGDAGDREADGARADDVKLGGVPDADLEGGRNEKGSGDCVEEGRVKPGEERK